MGKKAQERSFNPAKEKSSCTRNFANIFEFRQSYGPCKLLADIKRGSARYPGSSYFENTDLEKSYAGKYENDDANDVDVVGGMANDSRFSSVKELIEEEMSKDQISKDFDSKFKSNKRMTKNDAGDPDPLINNLLDSAQVVLEQFTCREPVGSSNFIFDLAAFMIEFYSVSRHCPDLHSEKNAALCTPSRSSFHKKNLRLDESESQLAKHSMLQEALVVEAEVFLSQKIDDAKSVVGNGAIHSQEFMDALGILNSNKELFLKLIQDPNSLVFNHIHELLKQRIADFSKLDAFNCLEESRHFEDKLGKSDQNTKSSSNQMFPKQKVHFFSTKKDKCKEKKVKTFDESSRIVVLKPRNPGNSSMDGSLFSHSNYTKKQEKCSDKAMSHFSFKEIKRKLRHIIGNNKKEPHLMPRDDCFNRIPYEVSSGTDGMTSTAHNCQITLSKLDYRTENTFQSSSEPKVDADIAQGKIQGSSPASPLLRDSLSKELEQHFPRNLGTENRTVNLTNNMNSISLLEMLSLSDNLNSPRFSPSADDITPSHVATFFEPKLQFSNSAIFEGTTVSSDLDMEFIYSVEEKDRIELQDETCKEELYTGRTEIVEMEIINVYSTEPANSLDINTAPDGMEHSSPCENKEGECSILSEQITPIEKPRILIPSASISPSSLILNDYISSELNGEKPERPSPVSVLEPFFLEDDASPDHASTKYDELCLPLQPIYINHDEDSAVKSTSDLPIPHQRYCSSDMDAIANYLRLVLETYCFDSEMIPERLSSTVLSLQSASDEIRALSSYPEEPKLILDSLIEVLLQTLDRRFQTTSCMSFLKFSVRPFLKELIIQQVCKTIVIYLSSQFQPSLNEIMKKDMDSTMWMDLRLEMDCTSAEIGCSIFEDLMEETMFELTLETSI